MNVSVSSEYLGLVKKRVNWRVIPCSDRGSRLLIDRWMFEDEKGTGQNPPTAASMFGWSSAVFIDLAIQSARERSQ